MLAQGEDIVPIPGTKRLRYLEDNLGALDVALTPDEFAQIDSLFPPGIAQGERYAEAGMALLNPRRARRGPSNGRTLGVWWEFVTT